MKSVWIKADAVPWEERKPIITFALESGADCVLVSEADVDAVKQLGTITVAAFDEDRGGHADIDVVGKGGEGDGTLPLSGPAKETTDYKRLDSLTSASAAYVVAVSYTHLTLPTNREV